MEKKIDDVSLGELYDYRVNLTGKIEDVTKTIDNKHGIIFISILGLFIQMSLCFGGIFKYEILNSIISTVLIINSGVNIFQCFSLHKKLESLSTKYDIVSKEIDNIKNKNISKNNSLNDNYSKEDDVILKECQIKNKPLVRKLTIFNKKH